MATNPYLFDAPGEELIRSSFGQQRSARAPKINIPYAQAMRDISTVPMVGPGDAIYMRQLAGKADVENRFAAQAASRLTQDQVASEVGMREARDRAIRQNIEWRRQFEGALTDHARESGGRFTKSMEGLAVGVGRIDSGLRKETGKGLIDTIRDHADDLKAKAAAAREAEAGPVRRPLSGAYESLMSGVRATDEDVPDAHLQYFGEGKISKREHAELEDLLRRRKEYMSAEWPGSYPDDEPSPELLHNKMLWAAESALDREGANIRFEPGSLDDDGFYQPSRPIEAPTPLGGPVPERLRNRGSVLYPLREPYQEPWYPSSKEIDPLREQEAINHIIDLVASRPPGTYPELEAWLMETGAARERPSWQQPRSPIGADVEMVKGLDWSSAMAPVGNYIAGE
jgi:hypothetical protein